MTMNYDSMIKMAIHFRVLSILAYVCTGEFRETEDPEEYRNGMGNARIVRDLDVRGVCELVLMMMIRQDMGRNILPLPELRDLLRKMADNGHIVRGKDIYLNNVYYIPQTVYDDVLANLQKSFENRGIQVIETTYTTLSPEEYAVCYGKL